MKIGKYIKLGVHKNIKIGYGSIDYKNLKTIYLKLNSWVLPKNEINEFENNINKSKKRIKDLLYNLNDDKFKREFIIDFDIRTKGITLNKSSFMDLEITLYTNKQYDIKHILFKKDIKKILLSIINECLDNENEYKFYDKKF